MSTHIPGTFYSITKAVADGVLLDVSPIAAKAGLGYPTFMTSSLWNDDQFEGSETRALLALEGVRNWLESYMPPGKDTAEFGISPNLAKHNLPRSACPWGLGVRVVRERSERFGWVVFVMQIGESLDFRIPGTTGGSFFPM